MRSTFLFGLAICSALGASIGPAFSDSASDEALIGPVEYQQDVNGIQVTLTANTYVKVATDTGKLMLRARVLGDLFDLQRKIGPIVDTFDIPRDNCRSYSANNPVVSMPRKELTFKNGQAVFSIGATVEMWDCRENPVPNSKIEMRTKNVGFGVKLDVPTVVTWPGNPIKNKIATQPIDADLPIDLVRNNDHSAGLQFSKPDIQLKGQYAFITNGVLSLAGVNINQKAYDALQKAIDPTKLQLTMPTELARFNPSIVSSRFFDNGGHLTAEITLEALVPADTLTDFVRELVKHKDPQTAATAP